MIEQIELIFRLSRASNARLLLSGSITQESIDLLIKILETSKDTFPTNAELKADIEAMKVVMSYLIWQLQIERQGRIKKADCSASNGL